VTPPTQPLQLFVIYAPVIMDRLLSVCTQPGDRGLLGSCSLEDECLVPVCVCV